MTQKKKTDTVPAEMEVVDLDPPNPAIVRWQELADRVLPIQHDGDATKLLDFPRPEWSDEDADFVGDSAFNVAYRSERVSVAAKGCSSARNVAGLMTPAHVNVIAELWSSGTKRSTSVLLDSRAASGTTPCSAYAQTRVPNSSSRCRLRSICTAV